jgi:hypothetical protein
LRVILTEYKAVGSSLKGSNTNECK